MKTATSTFIKSLHLCLLNQKISEKDANVIAERLKSAGISETQYLYELILSPRQLRTAIEKAQDLHLYYAHFARLLLVSSLLPKADKIVDLGGANGSIYEMGYPHKFKEIVVVDLPPDERDPMYKNLELKPTVTKNGKIRVHLGDMSDLSFIKDNSVDLVWSGESIEHIDETLGERMVREAYRVLKPGGSFCLDTPNRLVTQIHTSGYIHPEHKLEYYPKQLQRMLKRSGFKIIDQRGIRDMPQTFKTKIFNYTDYILGSPITTDIESAYMQYYHCIKPHSTGYNLRRKVVEIKGKTRRAIKRIRE